MSQNQATLPFSPHSGVDYDQYVGNESVIEALKSYQELPDFVYVFGGRYSGKSHLFNALKHNLELETVSFAVDAIYLTQVELTQILPKDLRYLLLDDVQDLAGDEVAELALFNLFNHCKAQGITLVVFASIHSKSSEWKLPDLISRLNSGLNQKLETLQGDGALSCIVNQFRLNGIPLDGAVTHYLQSYFSSDFADLYSLFLKVSIESLKLKRKVTVPLVKQIIQAKS